MDGAAQNTEEEGATTAQPPLQRIHIFIWNIFNIIRNMNLLKQWLQIKYGPREMVSLGAVQQTHTSLPTMEDIAATNKQIVQHNPTCHHVTRMLL